MGVQPQQTKNMALLNRDGLQHMDLPAAWSFCCCLSCWEKGVPQHCPQAARTTVVPVSIVAADIKGRKVCGAL